MRIRLLEDQYQDAVEIKVFEYDQFTLPLTQNVKQETRIIFIDRAIRLAINLRNLADAIEIACGIDPDETYI